MAIFIYPSLPSSLWISTEAMITGGTSPPPFFSKLSFKGPQWGSLESIYTPLSGHFALWLGKKLPTCLEEFFGWKQVGAMEEMKLRAKALEDLQYQEAG